MKITDIINKLVLTDLKLNDIFSRLKNLNDQVITQKIITCWQSFLSEDYDKAGIFSQVIIDYTWEELNTGDWKEVDIVWRKIYSFGSLVKSLVLYRNNDFENSIKICDMGLLMGAPIYGNILAALASNLIQIDNKEDNVVLTKKMKIMNETKDQQISDSKTKFEQSYPEIKQQYQIYCESSPSLLIFQQNYLNLEKPVILKDCMGHWPALCGNHKWTIDYLKEIAGRRTVPVEIGRQYTSQDWTQKLMTMSNFIDKFILSFDSNGYLAQHQLFDQIPELSNDIITPDYCYLNKFSEKENFDDPMIQAWFGPKGTISPLHHDPYHNIFAQVVGQKYIRLYHPKDTTSVYPHDDGMLHNTSQVDVENFDMKKFPKFKDAHYFECILNEGEMLYIPKKWWHYVRSLSVSFSVSFWW